MSEQRELLLYRWRVAVPALTTVAALALMTAPLFTGMPALPHLGLLAVFAWVLFQPALMPTWLAFLLGILADLWLALPLGINATLFPLVVIAVATIERRFGHRPHSLDWALFALVALSFQLLTWELLDFSRGAPAFAPLLVQAGTTILAYPIVIRLLARVQRRWVDLP